MGLTALTLAALISAGAGATGKSRLLVLPLRADAPAEERALYDSVAEAARAHPALTWVEYPIARVTDEAVLERRIQTTLTEVQAAYRRLDTDEATRQLQALENSELAVLGCPERISLAAKISFWLGVVSAPTNPVRAAERFAAVLSTDPAYPIDASYFPPQTVAIFEKVRWGLAAAPTGGLSISGEPDGAEVFLDGKPAGQAPVTLNASEGEHFVCVRKIGWKDWAARLRLTAGKVDTQRIYLQRASPAELGQKLSALFNGKPPSLAEPEQVEALARVLGVDVVAEVGAGSLRWRAGRGADELHQAQVTEPGAPPGRQLIAALTAPLEPASTSPPAPVPVRAAASFTLDLALHGGLGFGMNRGGLFGARISFFWFPAGAVGVGVRLGVGKGFGELPLWDPNGPGGRPTAIAPDVLEAPLGFGARWTFLEGERVRLSADLGLGVRFLSAGVPSAPQAPPPAPLVTLLPPIAPLSLLLVGPRAGLVTVLSFTRSLGLVVGVEYGLEVRLARPPVIARVEGGNPPVPPMNIGLTTENLLHAVGLELGLQLKFE